MSGVCLFAHMGPHIVALDFERTLLAYMGRMASLHFRESPNTFRSSPLFQSVARIYPDLVKTLKALRTQDENSKRLRDNALRDWSLLATTLNLTETRANLAKITAERPGTPSDETRYWKISRHCFWAQCTCSFEAHHHLRVCTGCRRVLYCNASCQAK